VAVYRQDIIKYVTDRPGEVIYRSEIMESGNFTAVQVTNAILSVQKDSPIGSEIETVVRGNAWRYVPRRSAASHDDAVVARNRSLPITTLIRQYLVDHPNTVVWAHQLAAYTGRTEAQVKVGINNMRQIQVHADVVPYVKKVIQGQSWRFEPPVGWRPGVIRPIPTASPSSTSSTPLLVNDRSVAAPISGANNVVDGIDNVTSATTINVVANDGNVGVRMFEEVGTTDDAIIIRDHNNVMYRATRLR
jgi:hypothetical protein